MIKVIINKKEMEQFKLTFIDQFDYSECPLDWSPSWNQQDFLYGIESENRDHVQHLQPHSRDHDFVSQDVIEAPEVNHSEEDLKSLQGSHKDSNQNFSGEMSCLGMQMINSEKYSFERSSSLEFQPKPSEPDQPQKKKVNLGDIRKNAYGNIIKQTIKSYVSPFFSKKVQWIHTRLGILDSQKAKNVFKCWISLSICFGDAYYLLKDRTGTNEEILAKKAFSVFFQWYNRNHYSLYVLNQEQILYTDQYLKVKNLLLEVLKSQNNLKTLKRKGHKLESSPKNKSQEPEVLISSAQTLPEQKIPLTFDS